MTPEMYFYVDDSGARDLDRKPPSEPSKPDWFALGGIIVRSEDKGEIEDRLREFRARWPQTDGVPLHSYDIRHATYGFSWLGKCEQSVRESFLGDLAQVIETIPIVCVACVIDRPGYDARYRQKYGTRKWLLCKTAFSIVVERAAKFSLHSGRRLRVFVERTDRLHEKRLLEYYLDMKNRAAPFDGVNSAKYQPLSQSAMNGTLYDFKVKTKQSDLMQIADLVLWPMCQGGYRPANRTYAHLKASGKLIDSHCKPENGLLGVKYSCFDQA